MPCSTAMTDLLAEAMVSITELTEKARGCRSHCSPLRDVAADVVLSESVSMALMLVYSRYG